MGRDDEPQGRADTTPQERLAALLDASPAVLYSFRAGGDHAPTFVSPNIERLFGYEPREYLERPGFWRERVHPDDLPRAEAGFARLLEAGRCACEYRFRRKDGTCRWVEDRQRLVRAPDGGPDEVVGSWTDVDDRERAEAGRRDAERRLRDAVEGMPEPAALYDAGDRLVVCNRRYAEAFFPGREGLLRPGVPYRELLDAFARGGLLAEPEGGTRRTGRRASWSAAAARARRSRSRSPTAAASGSPSAGPARAAPSRCWPRSPT